MNLHWLVDKIPSLPNLSNLPQGIGIGRLATVIYGTVGSLMGGEVAVNSLTQPSSGCSGTSTWKFDSTHHSNRTIGNRSFYVHIPPSYKSNVAHAVVLSFHGYKGSDLKQEKISSLSNRGLTINGKVGLNIIPCLTYCLTGFDLTRASSPFTHWALGAQERMAVPDIALGKGHRMRKWAASRHLTFRTLTSS
jgi:hypothetical protein